MIPDVAQIRWGQVVIRPEIQAGLYWALKSEIDRAFDPAAQARLRESMRSALEWNAAKIKQHGTWADMKIATGTGVKEGRGGKVHKVPKHGIAR